MVACGLSHLASAGMEYPPFRWAEVRALSAPLILACYTSGRATSLEWSQVVKRNPRLLGCRSQEFSFLSTELEGMRNEIGLPLPLRDYILWLGTEISLFGYNHLQRNFPVETYWGEGVCWGLSGLDFCCCYEDLIEFLYNFLLLLYALRTNSRNFKY